MFRPSIRRRTASRTSARGRRLGTAVGAIALVIALSACGDGANGSSSGDPTGTAADEAGIAAAKAAVQASENQEFTVEPLSAKPPTGKRIAFVTCSLTVCSGDSVTAPAKALGWESDIFYFDLTKGPQDFLNAVKAALASDPDYLMVNQLFPESIDEAQIKEAESAGIPYIDLTGSEFPGVTSTILSQKVYAQSGVLAADLTLALAGKPTSVLIPIDTSLPNFASALPGTQSEFAKQSPSTKVEVLKTSIAAPQTETVSQTINYLKSHPDIKWLVYSGGPAFAAGMQQGLDQAGLSEKVGIVVGYLATDDNLDSVKSGEWDGGVGLDGNFVWQGVDVAARLSVGDDIGSATPPSRFRTFRTEDADATLFPTDYDRTYETAWLVD